MRKLRIWAMTALTMAVTALVFLVLMFLSLVDISRGEEDVLVEWAIVKLGLVVVFILILVTLVCTGLVLKYFKDKEEQERNRTSL